MPLPEGWVETTLGGVVELKYGKGLSKNTRDGGAYPVYGSNGIVGFHSESLIQPPCLIVGRKGSIGEVHFSDKPCWPIDTTYFVNEFCEQPAKYWYFFLRYLPLGDMNRASAIPGLNREDAYQLDIPLPPLNEQRRIVTKLEAVLAKVQSAQAHLDKIPGILKHIRQAILSAAVSGKLTEDWRGSDELIEWTVKKLVDIGQLQLGKMLDKEKNKGVLTGYLRNINVRWGSFDLDDTLEMRFQDNELEKFSIQDGDLIICEGGEPGRCAVWRNGPTSLKYQKALHRIRFEQNTIPEFGYYYLKHLADTGLLEDYFTGTTIKHLTRESLSRVSIPVPPLEEQKEVVRRVEALFGRLDRIEAAYQAAKTQVDTITQSTLAKAFRGELVPQDSNDEPAIILLERIKAERLQQASQPKTKRMPKKSKVFVEQVKDSLQLSDEVRDMVEQKVKDLLEVLKNSSKGLSPEALLREAGYGDDTDSIEAFYKALKYHTESKQIQEEKQPDRKVLLSAVTHENR